MDGRIHIQQSVHKMQYREKGFGRKRICAVAQFVLLPNERLVRGGDKTRRVKQIHNVLARPRNVVCLMVSQFPSIH